MFSWEKVSHSDFLFLSFPVFSPFFQDKVDPKEGNVKYSLDCFWFKSFGKLQKFEGRFCFFSFVESSFRFVESFYFFFFVFFVDFVKK